jgi:hypothetical protein
MLTPSVSSKTQKLSVQPNTLHRQFQLVATDLNEVYILYHAPIVCTMSLFLLLDLYLMYVK